MLYIYPFNRKKRRLQSKIKSKSKIRCTAHSNKFYIDCFSTPNKRLTDLIFRYIEPKQLICSCIYVSKKWKRVLLNSDLWEYYESNYGILSRITVDKTKLISERRSKGKVYVGKYLCNSSRNRKNYESVIVRRVNLELTNAGKDDGVPSSSLREITYLQKIQHPNVIKYYGSQIIDTNLYIVTEYVDYNLSEYILRKHNEYKSRNVCKSVIKNEIMKIMFDLLNVVSFIHSNKVFHRNLKPENIFIKTRVKVVDGCLCYTYKSLKIGDLSLGRLTGLMKYSPEEPKERDPSFRECKRLLYRAPEIILRCNSYDEYSDLWSVGILFYEIVCNEPLIIAFNEIGLAWEIFKMAGFPKYSKILNISKNMYKEWDRITLPAKPICIKHVIRSSRSIKKYIEFKNKYQETGQLELFQKFVKFCNLMGSECLKLLFSLTDITPSHRPKLKCILKKDTLWDLQYDPNLCVCIKNNVKCEFHGLYTKIKLNFNSKMSINSNLVKSIHTIALCNLTYTTTNAHIHDSDINFKILYKYIVNWYFDVGERLDLSSITIHTAVHYVLSVISSWNNINSKQLVGITISCIKISHRINEVSQEYYKCDNSSEFLDFASISDDIQRILSSTKDKKVVRTIPNRAELVYFEKRILSLINFKLFHDSLSYLVINFGKIMNIKIDSCCFKFSLLLSDLCLYDVELAKFNNILKAQVIWLISLYKFTVKQTRSQQCVADMMTRSIKTWVKLNDKKSDKGESINSSSISTQPGNSTSESNNPSINGLESCGTKSFEDYTSMRDASLDKHNISDYDMKKMMKKLNRLMKTGVWNGNQSLWDAIKCVAIIEDIANKRSKKMSLDPIRYSIFKTRKLDYDIGGRVNIPVKFIKLIVDDKLHPQLNCISEHILCANLVQTLL